MTQAPVEIVEYATALRVDLNQTQYIIEQAAFGGDFILETEYSEALKQFYMKNATRVKTVTFTFSETSNYNVLDILKEWMNRIYDFKKNCFNSFNPVGVITITVDANNIDGQDGKIVLRNTYPTSLTYPTYDWADGNPIKIKSTFSFDDMGFSPLPRKTGISDISMDNTQWQQRTV
jgi:hypothetical protein